VRITKLKTSAAIDDQIERLLLRVNDPANATRGWVARLLTWGQRFGKKYGARIQRIADDIVDDACARFAPGTRVTSPGGPGVVVGMFALGAIAVQFDGKDAGGIYKMTDLTIV
jgi:hypothetical protein